MVKTSNALHFCLRVGEDPKILVAIKLQNTLRDTEDCFTVLSSHEVVSCFSSGAESTIVRQRNSMMGRKEGRWTANDIKSVTLRERAKLPPGE